MRRWINSVNLKAVLSRVLNLFIWNNAGKHNRETQRDADIHTKGNVGAVSR